MPLIKDGTILHSQSSLYPYQSVKFLTYIPKDQLLKGNRGHLNLLRCEQAHEKMVVITLRYMGP